MVIKYYDITLRECEIIKKHKTVPGKNLFLGHDSPWIASQACRVGGQNSHLQSVSGHTSRCKKSVLASKWCSESRTSASAISCCDITPLNHELITCDVNALHRDAEKGRTSGMTLWMGEPAKPYPCCPVASSRKLRAVIGVTSSYNRKTMRPTFRPSMVISNYR